MRDRSRRILELVMEKSGTAKNGESLLECVSNQDTELDIQYANQIENERTSSSQLLDISYNFVDMQANPENTDTSTNVKECEDNCAVGSSLVDIKNKELEIVPMPSTSYFHEDETDQFEESESSFNPTDSEYHSETTDGDQDGEKAECLEIDKSRKGKKRVRNENMWDRNLRKKNRMAGQKYKSAKTKKTMKEKKVQEPCMNCRLKCNEKISGPQRAEIHREFWHQDTTIDQKRQFLCSCLDEIAVQRNRERTGSRSGKRQYNLKYFFTTEGGKNQVCKKFFLRTLDVSQTFVKCALQKRQSGGIVECDKRGKQPSVNKVKEEVKHRIREHIMSYPCEESHYSRRRTAKKYLGSHLNISSMYQMYKDDCALKNVPSDEIGREWLYSEIFKTEFNLSFLPPSKDTCDACDEFLINLRQSSTMVERANVQAQYNSHLLEADKRYNLKKNDKDLSLNHPGQKVLMIDLQKCLPCPKLTNAQSFYSLKLWCFNYTIYDSTETQASCLMWDESIAGRGGNEMASCLVQYIQLLPQSTSVIIWTDNCPSQNRNIQLIMCYFYLLTINPHIKEITHKFLLRGHTHMEVDSIHSIIEREAKKCPNFQIVTPWDWMQLARISGKNKDFKIYEMTTLDFKDFNKLCNSSDSPFQKTKKTQNNENFLISKAVCMQVRQDTPGILYFKTDFDQELFSGVDFNRIGGRNRQSVPESLVTLRNTKNPISTKKFKDLQKLLKWVPVRFHHFFQSLVHNESLEENNDD